MTTNMDIEDLKPYGKGTNLNWLREQAIKLATNEKVKYRCHSFNLKLELNKVGALVLETVNLTKIYPVQLKRNLVETLSFTLAKRKTRGIVALENVNLKIKQREIFGLLGPNGAGKTTLIKIFCTLVLPSKGTAMVNGYDVIKERSNVIKNLGVMLPEMRGFYWRLKGRDNLEIYARLYEIRNVKERVDEVLDLVGLSKENAVKRFQEYSSGMKQKLALAKALLPDPPILLLDEPTLGLDVPTAVKVREIIREKLNRDEGKTVFLTTHNMMEAERLCGRIAIINKGRIVQLGRPGEIKRKMKPVMTIQFLIRPKGFRGKMREIRRIDGVIKVQKELKRGGYSLIDVVIEKGRDISPILNTVSKETKIFHINILEPSLEEIFLEATRRNENEK